MNPVFASPIASEAKSAKQFSPFIFYFLILRGIDRLAQELSVEKFLRETLISRELKN